MKTTNLIEDYLICPDADPVLEYEKWKAEGHHDNYTLADFESHIDNLKAAAKECLLEELSDGEVDEEKLTKAIKEYDGPLGDFKLARALILEKAGAIKYWTPLTQAALED